MTSVYNIVLYYKKNSVTPVREIIITNGLKENITMADRDSRRPYSVVTFADKTKVVSGRFFFIEGERPKTIDTRIDLSRIFERTVESDIDIAIERNLELFEEDDLERFRRDDSDLDDRTRFWIQACEYIVYLSLLDNIIRSGSSAHLSALDHPFDLPFSGISLRVFSKAVFQNLHLFIVVAKERGVSQKIGYSWFFYIERFISNWRQMFDEGSVNTVDIMRGVMEHIAQLYRRRCDTPSQMTATADNILKQRVPLLVDSAIRTRMADFTNELDKLKKENAQLKARLVQLERPK